MYKKKMLMKVLCGISVLSILAFSTSCVEYTKIPSNFSIKTIHGNEVKSTIRVENEDYCEIEAENNSLTTDIYMWKFTNLPTGVTYEYSGEHNEKIRINNNSLRGVDVSAELQCTNLSFKSNIKKILFKKIITEFTLSAETDTLDYNQSAVFTVDIIKNPYDRIVWTFPGKNVPYTLLYETSGEYNNILTIRNNYTYDASPDAARDLTMMVMATTNNTSQQLPLTMHGEEICSNGIFVSYNNTTNYSFFSYEDAIELSTMPTRLPLWESKYTWNWSDTLPTGTGINIYGDYDEHIYISNTGNVTHQMNITFTCKLNNITIGQQMVTFLPRINSVEWRVVEGSTDTFNIALANRRLRIKATPFLPQIKLVWDFSSLERSIMTTEIDHIGNDYYVTLICYSTTMTDIVTYIALTDFVSTFTQGVVIHEDTTGYSGIIQGMNNSPVTFPNSYTGTNSNAFEIRNDISSDFSSFDNSGINMEWWNQESPTNYWSVPFWYYNATYPDPSKNDPIDLLTLNDTDHTCTLSLRMPRIVNHNESLSLREFVTRMLYYCTDPDQYFEFPHRFWRNNSWYILTEIASTPLARPDDKYTYSMFSSFKEIFPDQLFKFENLMRGNLRWGKRLIIPDTVTTITGTPFAMDLGYTSAAASGMYNYSAAFFRSRAAYDELSLPNSLRKIDGAAFANGTIEGTAYGNKDYPKDVYWDLSGNTRETFDELMQNVDDRAFDDALFSWQLPDRPITPYWSRQGHVYINADFPVDSSGTLPVENLKMQITRFGYSTSLYLNNYAPPQ